MKKNTLTIFTLWLLCGTLNAQLVINEIFYNSPDSGVDSFEFIEILNTDAFDISLAGYVMTEGIKYNFPDTVLPAGELFVMTNDSLFMLDSFGITARQWPASENLNNAGESIVIKDPFEATVDSLQYDDALPWDLPADGNGYSLELCGVTRDNSLAINWYKSDTETTIMLNGTNLKCTPGLPNTVCSPFTDQVVITEIMYNPPETADFDTLEYIELYNTSDESIDLQGFFISEGFDYTFSSMEIDPGDYMLLAFNASAISTIFGKTAIQWDAGTTLANNIGEEIVLRDANGFLVDEVRYDIDLPYSVLADGDGYSLELCDPSLDNNFPFNWKISENYIGFSINNEPMFCTPGAPNSVNCIEADHVIDVLDLTFDNANLTIHAGETIRWQNTGIGSHNINGKQATFQNNPEGFFSSVPTPGPWNYSFTFDIVGAYDYRCDNHFQQGMTGKVTVLPALANEIVMTEILYHQPGGENSFDFVEFYNRSNTIIDLGDYFFADGVDYQFPNIAMDPGEYLVVTKDAEAFFDAFGVTAFEWTNGGLNNEGEMITLSNGFAIVDQVEFSDTAPWPEIADGEGASIMLCSPTSDNNNPFNWRFSTTQTSVATTTNPNLYIHATPGAPNDTCAEVPYIFFGEDIPVEVPEDIDTLTINLKMANLGTNVVGFVDVVVESLSTAIEGSDFTIQETTIDFEEGTFGEVTRGKLRIIINDDAIQEFTEKIVISLTNPVGAKLASTGMITINIIDNDGFNPNLYTEHTIGEVTTNDIEFVAESMGVAAALTGIVYGYNIHPEGLEFTLIDKSNKDDGIRVFRNDNPTNYSVQEGDEVTVYGIITQFNGLTQIIADNVVFQSADNILFDPEVTTLLKESTESKLVMIENLVVMNVQNVGPAVHYFVQDDNNLQYLMRLDDDVNISTIDLPEVFTAIGIGSQIDPGTAPFNAGYLFMPRYIEDIIPIISVNDPEALRVKIYPNPAKDQLIINTELRVEKMIVYNLLGQSLINHTPSDVNTMLDISLLSSGCYLLSCIHQNKMRTIRFVKE